jgi:hypothetical protein
LSGGRNSQLCWASTAVDHGRCLLGVASQCRSLWRRNTLSQSLHWTIRFCWCPGIKTQLSVIGYPSKLPLACLAQALKSFFTSCCRCALNSCITVYSSTDVTKYLIKKGFLVYSCHSQHDNFYYLFSTFWLSSGHSERVSIDIAPSFGSLISPHKILYQLV